MARPIVKGILGGARRIREVDPSFPAELLQLDKLRDFSTDGDDRDEAKVELNQREGLEYGDDRGGEIVHADVEPHAVRKE